MLLSRSIVLFAAVAGGCFVGTDGEKGSGLASEAACPPACLDEDRLETCMVDGSRFSVACHELGEGFVCNPEGDVGADGSAVAACGPPAPESTCDTCSPDDTVDMDETCNRCVEGANTAHLCTEGAAWDEPCTGGDCVEDDYGAYCVYPEDSGSDDAYVPDEPAGCGTCLDDWTSHECWEGEVYDVNCWDEYGGWCEDGTCVW